MVCLLIPHKIDAIPAEFTENQSPIGCPWPPLLEPALFEARNPIAAAIRVWKRFWFHPLDAGMSAHFREAGIMIHFLNCCLFAPVRISSALE